MRRRILPSLLLAVVGLALAVGCRGGSDPEAALQGFLSALRRGDAEAAWNGFSRQTRDGLEAFWQAKAPPGSARRPVKEVLFESGLVRTMREVVRVEVITQSGGKAVLELIDDADEKQQLRMVLEDGGWKVDLDLPKPRA
ncbi:MAG: DUF4878 domain-containing protein [Deltaproteobacteria bacterium]|nr:DUF4878 domain-containing protein [Deltaproteobacteria bacterium]